MSNGNSEIVFSLYSRPECHLCDEMLNALYKWQERFSFKIEIFNIDEQPELTARYAARIPLLAINDIEVCEYYFDERLFLQHLNNNDKTINHH